MDTKLTLKLNSDVISQAKEYARSKEQSLSKLVESYLNSLTQQSTAVECDDDEITPFVKSFRTGVKVPLDADYKQAFTNYMEEKYR
ncbi:DUF6364 family protein [Parabacteroides bouchesdurhonensis]|uniref:DUF6364 family protein n=1 Tax=Parabacteroides bouchesdurhonensis TaxID=1936995 RepID=UPI000E50B953|nr:DUF6364 family protein [Parabacteroides bouchesdurhonensis]RHJ91445.1 hypothetical protein DW095_10715 [Bacteroides sp. AM07-16]